MKKLVLILAAIAGLLLVGVDCYAQSKKKPQPVKFEPMSYKSGKFIVGNNTIERSQYSNYFINDEYTTVNSSDMMRKAGIGLMTGGSALTAAGVVLVAFGDQDMKTGINSNPVNDDLYSRGTSLCLAGVPCLVIGPCSLVSGIVLYCVGDVRLKRTADKYNGRKGGYSYLTSVPGGLALRF